MIRRNMFLNCFCCFSIYCSVKKFVGLLKIITIIITNLLMLVFNFLCPGNFVEYEDFGHFSKIPYRVIIYDILPYYENEIVKHDYYVGRLQDSTSFYRRTLQRKIIRNHYGYFSNDLTRKPFLCFRKMRIAVRTVLPKFAFLKSTNFTTREGLELRNIEDTYFDISDIIPQGLVSLGIKSECEQHTYQKIRLVKMKAFPRTLNSLRFQGTVPSHFELDLLREMKRSVDCIEYLEGNFCHPTIGILKGTTIRSLVLKHPAPLNDENELKIIFNEIRGLKRLHLSFGIIRASQFFLTMEPNETLEEIRLDASTGFHRYHNFLPEHLVGLVDKCPNLKSIYLNKTTARFPSIIKVCHLFPGQLRRIRHDGAIWKDRNRLSSLPGGSLCDIHGIPTEEEFREYRSNINTRNNEKKVIERMESVGSMRDFGREYVLSFGKIRVKNLIVGGEFRREGYQAINLMEGLEGLSIPVLEKESLLVISKNKTIKYLDVRIIKDVRILTKKFIQSYSPSIFYYLTGMYQLKELTIRGYRNKPQLEYQPVQNISELMFLSLFPNLRVVKFIDCYNVWEKRVRFRRFIARTNKSIKEIHISYGIEEKVFVRKS